MICALYQRMRCGRFRHQAAKRPAGSDRPFLDFSPPPDSAIGLNLFIFRVPDDMQNPLILD